MRKLALLLIILGCTAETMAQVIFSPLESEIRQPESEIAALRQTAAPLSLPFLDDFSTASVTPSENRWLTDGGVFINSRYGLNSVTKNVASFDGLDKNGLPYAQGSVAAGPSDTLTSKPINLANLSPNDSVYLSFYWQAGGLGNEPDATTSYLQLEFKEANGVWQPVWREVGLGRATDFAQVFVGLKESRYFHDAFQFRFRNVGQRNGMADVWNVDYVELDKGRRKGVNTTRDIGISQTVSPLLKNYTAMPHRQFRASPQQELAEEISATINNLGSLPGAISWRGFVKKAGTSAADTFLVSEGLIPGQATQYEISGQPRLNNLSLPEQGAFILEHGFVLHTREQNALQRANDSTFRKTEFNDYYAFDDGTAEGGFSFLGSGTTQVAQRVDLNEPDQVIAVRVYFPRVRNQLNNTSIALRVWADDNGKPGEMIGQQSLPIQYSDEMNAFYEVTLTTPLAVNGAFYVGWSQSGSLFLNIGLDRNTSVTGRRFLYTGATGWEADTTLDGAVMLRPVMKGEPLGIEDKEPGIEIPDEEEETIGLLVYPNPSAGTIYIDGEYKNLRIFDVTGREVYSQSYVPESTPIALEHLAAGLYTIRIETKESFITKKLILTKL